MSQENKKIPKIIHQIWIGNKPMPINLMNTWKEKHPDFEYICWTEEEFIKREMNFLCWEKINEIEEIAGKVDIMRMEILYKYGGIYIDADSICVEPFDEIIMSRQAFASYENEIKRNGLVSNGTIGFYQKHKLCYDAIGWIYNNDVSMKKTGKRAWQIVGPLLLTKLINNFKYQDLTIFPSYFFLPIHYTGVNYTGHKKVYAYQEWGSTKNNYENMNNVELPEELIDPKFEISILVSSYNTNEKFICDCLESILNQEGYFGIELVWIDDGSQQEHSEILMNLLQQFLNKSRFSKVIYKKLQENSGISKALNIGLNLCNNELIFKMDSDDIMFKNRIKKQIELMNNYPDCVICGTNLVYYYNENNKKEVTKHPSKITWEEYKKTRQHWFMNHPTLCYKKSAVLSVGGYNENLNTGEDFDIEIKLLKKYGVVYNVPDILLYYRIHENQMTYNDKTNTPLCKLLRMKYVYKMIQDEKIEILNSHIL
jgi:mannosyltransferase OCH1-like enzyme